MLRVVGPRLVGLLVRVAARLEQLQTRLEVEIMRGVRAVALRRRRRLDRSQRRHRLEFSQRASLWWILRQSRHCRLFLNR